MSHRNFEKPDKTENVENVEKTEKTGKEKESILGKVKNFFAEHGKAREGKENKEDKESKEGKENKENKEGREGKEDTEKKAETPEEKRNAFEERLKAGAPTREQIYQEAKKFREAHGLDEHGNRLDNKRPEGGYERERGDDGPRSRFDDPDEGKENKENKENKDNRENREKTGENNENSDKNTDDE